MKKLTQHIKIGATLILLVISTTLMAKKGDVEKSKSIDKTFTVKAETEIVVENKFGEMKVTNWDKNEVYLKVDIKVKDANEKKSQEMLDRIKIEINESDSKLSIITSMGEDNNKTKIKVSGNGYLNIDYELKVPRNNSLNLKNAFGPLMLDDRTGKTKINLSFAGGTIGKLEGEENKLKFSFADPVVISHINKGSLKVQHSKLELGSANDITIKSEMSTIKSDELNTADLNLQFGSADIKDINTLKLNSQMSSVNIASLVLEGIIDANYGSVKIANIPKELEKLNIKAEFSPIKIELAKEGYFDTHALSKMGSLKLPAGSINLIQKDDDDGVHFSSKKEFKGLLGKKKEKVSVIEIENSFGDIKIVITD